MDYNVHHHYPSYNTGINIMGSNVQGGVGAGGAVTGGMAAHHRDMHRVGRDLGKDPRKLRAASSRRQKRGQCLSCGEQLFKVGVFGKKTPLTTAHVLNGRCLVCYPLAMDDTTTGDDLGRYEVPRVLHVRQRHRHPHPHSGAADDDAVTVVSAITIDPKLLTESGEIVEEGSDDGDNPQKTPHKALLMRSPGGAEPSPEPALPAAAAAAASQGQLAAPVVALERPSRPTSASKPTAPATAAPPPPPVDPLSLVRQTSIVWMPPPPLREAPGEDDHGIDDNNNNNIQSAPEEEEKAELNGAESELYRSRASLPQHNGDVNDDLNDDSAFDDLPSMVDLDLSCSYCSTTNHESTSFREIHVEPETLPPDDPYDDEDNVDVAHFEPHIPPFVLRQSSAAFKTSTPEENLQDHHSANSSSADGAPETGTAPPTWVAESGGSLFPRDTAPDSGLPGGDPAALVRELLETLQPSRKGSSSPQSKRQSQIQTLHRLGVVLGARGNDARRTFCQQGGIRTVTGHLWAGSADPDVLEAALRLVLALVASPANDALLECDTEPLLVGEDGEACVDALLISMQTTVEHIAVQELGCLVLAGLARLSSTKATAPSFDGGEMGAVQTVLRAMARHPAAPSVQEAAVRALYNQCCWSANADVNQRALLTGCLDDGTPSGEVLTQSLREAAHEPLLLELFCQLFWCLSAAPLAPNALSAEPMGIMIAAAWSVSDVPDSLPLLEAVMGACANLSLLQGLESEVSREAARLALELLPGHRRCPALVTEACCAIANLVENVEEIDSLPVANAMTAIVKALGSFDDDRDLQDEGIRALVALSISSSVARNVLLEDTLYSQLMALGRARDGSPSFHVPFCRLLAALCLHTCAVPGPILAEMMALICQMASLHQETEPIQDLACLLWRELSSQKEACRALLSLDAETCVLMAMKKHQPSESIQRNACCALSCLRFQSFAIDDRESMSAIVEALKFHLASPRVAEAACGALWSITYASEARKLALLQIEGAIETVFSALVVYPDNEGFLGKAVGLLASLGSSHALAKQVFTLERVEAVVDTIRSNRANLSVLELCTLFLRNAVCFAPELADPANRALSVVLGAMKDHASQDCAGFLIEGCNLLWAISAQSNGSKALVLELDGMSVLMGTLEKQTSGPVLQPALGAFNELALNWY